MKCGEALTSFLSEQECVFGELDTKSYIMGKFKFTIYLIIGAAFTSRIVLSLPNETEVQSNTVEGLCVFYQYESNRYACNLHNAVIASPNDVLLITGNHLPNHSDSDVRVVIHQNVTISYFNGEILRKFVNLEYLAIGAAGVVEFNENAFDVCEKLDHVYIGFNSLETFPSKMLKNCVNLRHFDSYFNNILSSIPEDLFGDTTNLEIFEVTSSRLSSLPSDLLRNMSNLKKFEFRSNPIANIDSSLLVNAINLESVDLSTNSISDTSVITNLLNGHTTLKSIQLNRNRFTSFNFTFFSQFTKLTKLEIGSEKFLSNIDWKSLPTSLTSIYVSNIGEEVPVDAVSHLVNLKRLAFSGDGITELHADTFSQLVNLESLSIQFTQIRTLPSNIFANQKNLTQLHLGFNNIEELAEGLFASLENLGSKISPLQDDLSIVRNRIQRLNANSFGYHPHLQNLLLSYNDITEIDREIFARFPNPMKAVDLTSNKCTSAYFQYQPDLQNENRLADCFDNWDGIRSTAVVPSGACGIRVGVSSLVMGLIVGLLRIVLIN